MGQVHQNVFCAIAVVHVEIKHGYSRKTAGQCLENGDGDRIQVAETHHPLARGVVPRWTQEAEGHFAGARRFQGGHRTTHRVSGVLKNLWIDWRVAIEIMSRLLKKRDMLL